MRRGGGRAGAWRRDPHRRGNGGWEAEVAQQGLRCRSCPWEPRTGRRPGPAPGTPAPAGGAAGEPPAGVPVPSCGPAGGRPGRWPSLGSGPQRGGGKEAAFLPSCPCVSRFLFRPGCGQPAPSVGKGRAGAHRLWALTLWAAGPRPLSRPGGPPCGPPALAQGRPTPGLYSVRPRWGGLGGSSRPARHAPGLSLWGSASSRPAAPGLAL